MKTPTAVALLRAQHGEANARMIALTEQRRAKRARSKRRLAFWGEVAVQIENGNCNNAADTRPLPGGPTIPHVSCSAWSGGLFRAESAPPGVASGRTAVRAKGVIPIASPKQASAPEAGVRRRYQSANAGQPHSSASPALRTPSNRGGSFGAWSVSHLTVRLGLRRRASANADFASSVLPARA